MVSRKHGQGSAAHAVDQGHEQSHAKPDDVLVMATNNSSIVSKRSVERLYYPDEPHFFRFFVPKFQRRAPLINRGYYFRLKTIDLTLRDFLRQPSPSPSSKTKCVVNLGAGFDVLPWQCWFRYPECAHDNVRFVDVDFPELLRKKRQVVLNTPELAAPLSRVHDIADACSNVLLRSDRYVQIGVDLRDIAALEAALNSVLDIQDCHFLFVAEVSITYMETSAADRLVEWAAALGQAAEFCLLEQILPDGPGHPFAKQMTSHFEKLSCPIKSVATYQTIPQQQRRFATRGWSEVQAQSLWSAWIGSSFLTSADRQRLDQVEPFDEHEEFALFASHYLLLHARSYGNRTVPCNEPITQTTTKEAEATFTKLPGQYGLRRFGAAMTVKDPFGNESIINCLGLGNNNRLSSYDVYSRGPSRMHIAPTGGPQPSRRMCATVTDLGHKALLVGGRSSPAKPMSDCWIFEKDAKKWERTWDLPIPLYRHSACRLGDSSLVLVLGGRPCDKAVSKLITVYHPDHGWLECRIGGTTLPKLVFSAVLICSGPRPGCQSIFDGYLAGGHSGAGVHQKVQAWTLSFGDDEEPTITFAEAQVRGSNTVPLISRFGAACAQERGFFVLLGGVGINGVVKREDDIVVFTTSESGIEATVRLTLPLGDIPRPLIVGSSVVLSADGDLILVGGAATCFSMGTFWTRGIYALRLSGERRVRAPDLKWEFSHSGEIVQTPTSDPHPAEASPSVVPVDRVRLSAALSFQDIIVQGRPVILEGLDMGPCTSKWSLDHLAARIGQDRKVVVHDSHVQHMDFNAKNFRYTTMNFGDFTRQVKRDKRLYLRSLSADAPTDHPANLKQDFPMLSSDFVLPYELKIGEDKIHSSILRISGPVQMWLHFDVQANVYCQIQGSKRMIIFPPSDITRLSFAPGSSSSSVDVFGSSTSPVPAGTHPLEAQLRPGDVLYLPPLWLHTAAPTCGVSVAVNVFFRNLESAQYATGRDVYGNRDLAVYDKGRQDISRITHSFSKVPAIYRQFYLLRLADELADTARHAED